MKAHEYKLKIQPDNYRGWELEWRQQHDGRSFIAEKKGAYIYASELQSLFRDIDEAEKKTVRLKTPILAYKMDDYQGKRVGITIHTVIGDRFYFTDEKGQDRGDYIKNAAIETGSSNPKICYIVADERTEALYDEASKVSRRAYALESKCRKLLAQAKPVTDADILLATEL